MRYQTHNIYHTWKILGPKECDLKLSMRREMARNPVFTQFNWPLYCRTPYTVYLSLCNNFIQFSRLSGVHLHELLFIVSKPILYPLIICDVCETIFFSVIHSFGRFFQAHSIHSLCVLCFHLIATHIHSTLIHWMNDHYLV